MTSVKILLCNLNTIMKSRIFIEKYGMCYVSISLLPHTPHTPMLRKISYFIKRIILHDSICKVWLQNKNEAWLQNE